MLKFLSKSKCIIIISIVFILGFLFVITNKPQSYKELFSNKKRQCPNILIKKDKFIYLHNSKLAVIPGVNPIKFNNLEDYVEFTNWQRSQGIDCPILFLQHSYDTQGSSIYSIRPSPTNLQGGLSPMAPIDLAQRQQSQLLDANRDDAPYNKNSYPGYDPQNQYIGLNTPIDKIFHENPGGISPNPTDPNWGGSAYTQSLINKGVYKGDVVKIDVNT